MITTMILYVMFILEAWYMSMHKSTNVWEDKHVHVCRTQTCFSLRVGPFHKISTYYEATKQNLPALRKATILNVLYCAFTAHSGPWHIACMCIATCHKNVQKSYKIVM